MSIQDKYKIISNKKLGPGYFRMAIRAPRIARQALPGQFVHLRCNDGIEPLLRRPFSFHRINHDSFEILYKVIGRGTTLLAKKEKGDIIDVLGPLGNGFELQRGNRPALLIAGGMGVAPLLALAESVRNRKNTFVFLGARKRKEILCAHDFRKLGLAVQIATDDGSLGRKGLVTELLKDFLRSSHEGIRRREYARRTMVYACGPKAMLRELARISRRFKLKAQGSFEERMACGIGACLSCALKTTKGYLRVCKDGPIFNLEHIQWKEGNR